MYRYINEINKTNRALYLLDKNNSRITKEEIDTAEIYLYKLSTLNKIYKSDDYEQKIQNTQKNINDKKNLIAVADLFNLATKEALARRGFSTSVLKEYAKNYKSSLISNYPKEDIFVKTKNIIFPK